MSRTFKDRPWKYTQEKLEKDVSGETLIGTLHGWYYWHREIAGAKTKKKRHFKGHWVGYYFSTPSWWIREFMTVPKRAACRNWEKTRNFDNLDEVCPDYGRRPHLYYY